MVKLKIVHNGDEKKLIASEQKPIKDILDEGEVGFTPFDSVVLNGKKLSADELEKCILELGFDESSEITVNIEDDVPWETSDSEKPEFGSVIYPPKAQVIGCACIIFSAFTLDELKEMQQFMPDAMTMRDDKGEPIFAISVDETQPGSLNKYGAVFSGKTTSQGNATITIVLDPTCENTEKLVREKLGSAILSLVDMEEYLVKKLPDLHKRKGLLDDYVMKT